MRVLVTEHPLDPWSELAAREKARAVSGNVGAASVFVGSMRDFNQNTVVTDMRLEHYAGMTERELERLVDEANRQWELVDSLIVHRVGALKPGDPIVLVACWAAHREEAFAACRFLIENLKKRATFWKLETTSTGPRWVDPA